MKISVNLRYETQEKNTKVTQLLMTLKNGTNARSDVGQQYNHIKVLQKPCIVHMYLKGFEEFKVNIIQCPPWKVSMLQMHSLICS